MLTLQSDIKPLWSWITRHGMARRAGSVPIGWYQVEHANVERVIGRRAYALYHPEAKEPAELRHIQLKIRDGLVLVRVHRIDDPKQLTTHGRAWREIGTPASIARDASSM